MTLYFHGIEYRSGEPRRYSFMLPFLVVVRELCADFPKDLPAIQEKLQFAEEQIKKKLRHKKEKKGAWQKSEYEQQTHQLNQWILLHEVLLFLQQHQKLDQSLIDMQRFFFRLAEIELSEQSIVSQWEELKLWLVETGEQYFCDNFYLTFRSPDLSINKLLMVVLIAFWDGLPEYPPANWKLVIKPKLFPKIDWVCNSSFKNETVQIWQTKSSLGLLSFLQADLWAFWLECRSLSPQQAEKLPVNSLLQGTLFGEQTAEPAQPNPANLLAKTSNPKAMKQRFAAPHLPAKPAKLTLKINNTQHLAPKTVPESSLSLQPPAPKQADENIWSDAELFIKLPSNDEQLEFFAERPFETLEKMQRNLLRKHGAFSLQILFAILQQCAEQNKQIVGLNIEKLCCLFPAQSFFAADKKEVKIKKSDLLQKTWLVLQELSKVQVHRNHKTKQMSRVSPFVSFLGKIYQQPSPANTVEQTEDLVIFWQFFLDEIFLPDDQKLRSHLAAPYRLIPKHFFRYRLPREYNSLLFLYSYLLTYWWYNGSKNNGVCEILFSDLMACAWQNLAKSGYHRAQHKIMHYLRVLREKDLIGNYQILSNSQKNDLFAVQFYPTDEVKHALKQQWLPSALP